MSTAKLRAIRGFWVKQTARYDRGYSLIQRPVKLFQLTTFGALAIDLLNRYTHWEISMGILPITIIILAPTLWVMGWFDQERIHLTQAEAWYSYEHLNPMISGLNKKVDKILEILKQ